MMQQRAADARYAPQALPLSLIFATLPTSPHTCHVARYYFISPPYYADAAAAIDYRRQLCRRYAITPRLHIYCRLLPLRYAIMLRRLHMPL